MNIKKNTLKEKLKPVALVSSAGKKLPTEDTKFKHLSDKHSAVMKEKNDFEAKLKLEKDKLKKLQNETVDSKSKEIIYYDPSYNKNSPRDNIYRGKMTTNEPMNYQNFKRSISPGLLNNKIATKIQGIGFKDTKEIQELNPSDPRNYHLNTLKIGSRPNDYVDFNYPPKTSLNDPPYNLNTQKNPTNEPPYNLYTQKNQMNDPYYNLNTQKNQMNDPYYSNMHFNDFNKISSPLDQNNKLYTQQFFQNKRSVSPNSEYNYPEDKEQRTLRTNFDGNSSMFINDLYRNSIINNVYAQKILNYKQKKDSSNNNQNSNAIPTQDLKNLKRKISFAFDKTRNEGRLLTTAVTTCNLTNENPFSYKQTKFQAKPNSGNKLSTLMLSKSAEPVKRNEYATPTRKEIKSPDLSPTNINTTKTKNYNFFNFNSTSKNTFIKLTLAIMSGKGVNCEDRLITRDMRNEKGGVVDFCHSQTKHPSKQYKIKNIIASKSPSGKNKNIKHYTYKDRERASKLVQKWWREFLESYKHITTKIVKIQKVFRGLVVRRSLSDLLYVSIFGNNLSEKFFKQITLCIQRYVYAMFANKFVTETVKHRIIVGKIIKLQRNLRKFFFKLKTDLLMKPFIKLKKMILRIITRKYFNHWKNKIFEMKKAEIMIRGKMKTRELILKKVLINFKGYFHKNLKRYFQHWKKHFQKFTLYAHFHKWIKPEIHVKDVFVSNYNNKNRLTQANEILNKFLWKHYFIKDILKSFKIKNRYENIKKSLLKSVMYKEKFERKNLKKYIIKWRRSFIMKKTLIIKHDKSSNLVSKLYGKIIDMLIKKLSKRLISNRFSIWRRKLLMKNDFIKGKRLSVSTEKYIKKNFLYFLMKRFYEKLQIYRSKRYIDKRFKHAVVKKITKDIKINKKYFYKWKNHNSSPNYTIKLLKNYITRFNIVNLHKTINKSFYKWIYNTTPNLDKEINYRKIKEAENEDALENLHDPLKNLVRIPYEKNSNVKKYVRRDIQHIKLSKFFTNWWRFTKKEEHRILKNICKKMNLNNIKKIILRNLPIDAYFKRWYKNLIALKNLNNHRNRLKKIFNLLKQGILNLNLNKNLDFIENLKNLISHQYLEKALFKKLLPYCSKLNAKYINDKLIKAFKKWKHIVDRNEVKKLQFKVLYKMKNINLIGILRRKFNNWKNYQPINNNIYPGTIRGTNKLNDVLLMNQAPRLLNKLKKLSKKKSKEQKLEKLLCNTIGNLKDKLKDSLIKWWKKIIYLDKMIFKSKCKELTLKNIKKFILQNKPLNKFFKRWLKNLIEIKLGINIKNSQILLKIKNAIKSSINREVFPLINDHVSTNHVINSFFKMITPLCFNLKERMTQSLLRFNFNRWKKKNKLAKEKIIKLKILSSIKSLDDNLNFRRIFSLWRLKNLNLKNKMYEITIPRTINAISKIQNTLRKNITPELLEKLRVNREEKIKTLSLQNQIKNSLNCLKFHLRTYFNKWKNTNLNYNENKFKSVYEKMKELYLKSLKKSIQKIDKFSLEKYFRKWLRKIIILNMDRSAIDIFKAVKKLRDLYISKNGRDLLERIKIFMSPNHLKKTLLKTLLPTCKFLNKRNETENLRRYLQFWKKENSDYNLKNLKFKFVFKLKGKNLRDELRRKIVFWKKIASSIRKKINSYLPIIIEQLKRNFSKVPLEIMKKQYLQSKVNQLRDNIINKKLSKKGKFHLSYLRKCFLKWKVLLKDLLLNDFKSNLMTNKLKKFNKNHSLNKLRKAFISWSRDEPYIGDDDEFKNEKLMKLRKKWRKKHLFPYVIGEQIIRKVYQRNAFQIIIKKTELLNLKLPDNISLKQALLTSTKGISKNISIRIILLRCYLKKWREFIKQNEINELKDDIVKKMISKYNIFSHFPKRRIFQMWRNKTALISMKELQTEFKANIYKLLYHKHSKFLLREKFIFWKDKITNYKTKLENVVKGVGKLKKKIIKRNFHLFKRKLQNKTIFDIKKKISTKVLKRLIKATHQGNLLIYYNFWKKIISLYRERQLKDFILKSMINKFENNCLLKDMNLLKEVFLKWKINSMPTDVLKRITNNRKGISLLKKKIKKIYCECILYRLKKQLLSFKTKQNFKNQIELLDWNNKKDVIRQRLHHLYKLMFDRKNKLMKIKKMFNCHMLNCHVIYYSNLALELIGTMKEIHNEKSIKAKQIQRLYRSGRVNKRIEYLSKIIDINHSRNLKSLCSNLKRWNKNSNLIKVDNYARVVQNYIRDKLKRVKKEEEVINRLSSLSKNYMKNQFKELTKNVIDEEINPRSLRKAGVQNRKFLLKKYNYNLAFYFKKLRKNTEINSTNKSKQKEIVLKANYLKKEKKKDNALKLINKIFLNTKKKKENYLIAKLLFWKKSSIELFLNETVIKIQYAFKHRKLNKLLLIAFQKEKLRKLFFKIDKKELIKSLMEFSEDKGKLHSLKLENWAGELEKRISLNQILNHGIKKLRNGLIDTIIDKLFKKDRTFTISKYLRLWKKTIENYHKKSNHIQNKYKKFMAKKKLEKQNTVREKLLSLATSYQNDDNTIKSTYFTQYRNKIKIQIMKDSVKQIENFLIKGLEDKKIKSLINCFYDFAAKMIVNAIKYCPKINQLRKIISRKTNRETFELFEKRNIFDLVRNKLSKKMTISEAFHTKESLRRRLLRFRENAIALKYREINAVKKIIRAFLKYVKKLHHLIEDKKFKSRILILLLDKSKLNLMHICFINWLKKIKREHLHENACILVKYMKKIKNVIKKRKNNNLPILHKGLLLLKKLNENHKLKKSLDEISNFKKNPITNLFYVVAKLYKKYLNDLFECIKHHKNYNKQIYDEKITTIQHHYKKHRIRKHLIDTINKFKKIRSILYLAADSNKREMYKSLRFWKRTSLKNLINLSAHTIQNFIRSNLNHHLNRKKKKLFYLFWDYYFNIKVIKGLKSSITVSKIYKAINNIKKYSLNKFLKNIHHYDRKKNLFKLFRLPDNVKTRHLYKYFTLWRKKYSKGKKIITRLENILKSIYLMHLDTRDYFFSKWRGISKMTSIMQAQETISNFFRHRFDNLKSTKKWFNLYQIISEDDFLKCKQIVRKELKNYGQIKKLVKAITNIIKRYSIHKLKQKNIRIVIKSVLEKEVSNHDNKKNSYFLKKLWKKWLKRVCQIKKKEIKLNDLVQILDNVRNINAVNYLNKAFTIKKFLGFKKAIEKKYYFEKLKRNYQFLSKFTNLKKILIQSIEYLDTHNLKTHFITNFYKIYTFKILFKLNLFIKRLLKLHSHNNFKKLIEKINQRKIESSINRFKTTFNSNYEPNVTTLKFMICTTKSKLLHNDDKSPNNHLIYISPILTHLIGRLLLENQKYAFERLKRIYIGKKFLIFMMRAVRCSIERNKFNTFNNLLRNKEKCSLRPHFMKHLRIVFRKYLIYNFTNQLKPVSKILLLINFLKITLIHKEIADDKYITECLSRWRFLAHMKIITKKKLQNLYKNMQTSYQSVAQEIFGDHDKVPGMIKEFGHFGNNISHLSNQVLHEKYFRKINLKLSENPINEEEKDEIRRQSKIKLRPRNLVLDNMVLYSEENNLTKEKEEYEILNTEQFFSNRSIVSQISFKSEESFTIEKPASNQTVSEKKNVISHNFPDLSKSKGPSTGTNRKSSIGAIKDEKKPPETVTYSKLKNTVTTKKSDLPIKKK